MSIEMFRHVCIVEKGAMAGSKRTHTVAPYEFESAERCPNCRAPLATDHEMLSHLYQQLTEGHTQ